MNPDPFITRARIGKAVSVLNRRRDSPSDGIDVNKPLVGFALGIGIGVLIVTILSFITQ